jgi:hypothetical protein
MTHAANRTRSSRTDDLIGALVSECRDPARLLELYYWSTEPALLPIIRGLVSLPNETRAQLQAFLLSAEPESIIAKLEADGQIRLAPGRQ